MSRTLTSVYLISQDTSEFDKIHSSEIAPSRRSSNDTAEAFKTVSQYRTYRIRLLSFCRSWRIFASVRRWKNYLYSSDCSPSTSPFSSARVTTSTLSTKSEYLDTSAVDVSNCDVTKTSTSCPSFSSDLSDNALFKSSQTTYCSCRHVTLWRDRDVSIGPTALSRTSVGSPSRTLLDDGQSSDL